MGSFGGLVPEIVRRRYLVKLAVVGLVFVGVVGVFGLVVYQDVDSTLQRQTEAELATTAERRAATFALWVQDRRQTTRMVSSFKEVRSKNRVTVRRKLQLELGRQPPAVAAFHYVDLSSGEILTSTDATVQGRTLDGIGIEWQTADGSLALGNAEDVVTSRVYERDGRTLLAFASPIVSNDAVGRGDRALLMTVNVTARAAQFRVAIDGGYVQVVDDRGLVAFDKQQGDTLEPYPYATVVGVGADSTAGGDPGGTGSVVSTDGLLIAAAPVEETNWVVLAHAPTANAYAIRSAVGRDLLALLGVVVLGVVVVGATFGRSTVTAVEDLATRAAELESGNLALTVDSDREDEFGQLYRAFDSMRQSLRERVREAERARQRLERTNAELENQKFVISVLHRVLRHNLRNDIHVIVAHAERIQADAAEGTDHVDRIVHHAEQLLDRSEQASQIEQIVERGEDAVRSFTLNTVLVPTVRNLRRQYPEADIAFDQEGEGDATVFGHPEIGTALEMLAESTIETTDAAASIRLSVLPADDDRVRVRFHEQTGAIPPSAVEQLREKGVTALRQGSTPSLWFLDWVVTASDGDLAIDASEDELRATITLSRQPAVTQTGDDADGTAVGSRDQAGDDQAEGGGADDEHESADDVADP